MEVDPKEGVMTEADVKAAVREKFVRGTPLPRRRSPVGERPVVVARLLRPDLLVVDREGHPPA